MGKTADAKRASLGNRCITGRYPWIFDTAGDVYFWGGAGFLPASTGLGCISSLAVGPTSAPFSGMFCDVWIVKDCGLTTTSGNIYQFQFGLS